MPSAWIDFAGPPGTVRSYSYSRVLDGKVPASAFTEQARRHRPVRVVAAGRPRHSGSGDEVMSGAEIQANVAETALHGFPLRSLWCGWDIVLIVLFGLIAPRREPAAAGLARAGARARHRRALRSSRHSSRSTTAGSSSSRIRCSRCCLSAIGVLVAEYLLEAFERVRTHDTFSRFVPEAVVEPGARAHRRRAAARRRARHGTAMFTDLRGFTTFSEGLDAEEVIGLLNGYLGEISDAVLAHGGTLVSYLGDGLMAVFGAPLPQEDHADRARRGGARDARGAAAAVQRDAARAGFERGFKMGIGLNSGEFMSGNVGSQRRLEYTAIGDTINTASRIEGMTKGTPYALYLADSTKEALTTPLDDLVYIDEMPVRGRTHPIKLWSLDARLRAEEGLGVGGREGGAVNRHRASSRVAVARIACRWPALAEGRGERRPGRCGVLSRFRCRTTLRRSPGRARRGKAPAVPQCPGS